jgi:hypothetical protein
MAPFQTLRSARCRKPAPPKRPASTIHSMTKLARCLRRRSGAQLPAAGSSARFAAGWLCATAVLLCRLCAAQDVDSYNYLAGQVGCCAHGIAHTAATRPASQLCYSNTNSQRLLKIFTGSTHKCLYYAAAGLQANPPSYTVTARWAQHRQLPRLPNWDEIRDAAADTWPELPEQYDPEFKNPCWWSTVRPCDGTVP